MTSHTPRPRLARALVAAILTILLGGCMSVPVLSGPPAHNGAQKSLTELREQAAEFTNATIDATGIRDGWYAGDKSYGSPGIPWETTDHLTEGYPPEKCGMGGDLRAAPHRIQVTLWHDTGGDPRPLAEKITAEWQKQGFKVRTVVQYRVRPDGYDMSIRGDGNNGTFVDFYASHEHKSITAYSECSTHPTVLEEVSNLIDNFSFDIPEFDDEPATETPSPEPSR